MISDQEKVVMSFKFLMNPRADDRVKEEYLMNLEESGDARTLRIAKYMADMDMNHKVKDAIICMMKLSQDELRECIKLVNG